MTIGKAKVPLLLICIVAVLGILWGFRKTDFGPDVQPRPKEVSVGWQRQWATQGQVMKALDNTNIRDLYRSRLILRDFQYGPDLNEAAVTGAIQVTNAGIVPIVNLLSKSNDWILVARHVDFLMAIISRQHSGIRSIADLRDKAFGVPTGGGSHPYALSRLLENGLMIGEGTGAVHVINVQPIDQPEYMKQGTVDAVAVWEPTISVLLRNGAQVVDQDTYYSFVAVKRSFANTYRHEIVQLLKSYRQAFLYAAQHKNEVDTWFSQASGVDLGLISTIRTIEPTLRARKINDIDLGADTRRVAKAQQVADMMYQLKLIDQPLQIKNRIDDSFYRQAEQEMQSDGDVTWRVHSR